MASLLSVSMTARDISTLLGALGVHDVLASCRAAELESSLPTVL